MILNVENACKHFMQGKSTIHALKDVSFSLLQGETLAIVGPSGSGKTTLLSLLAGLDAPSSGKIEVNNTLINNMTEKELASFRAQNIGIVFQQFHLMSHLTAEENVCLPLEILGVDDVEKKARELLELVGLSERMNHLPHQLSGGECQRVAIARASVIKPKILLADEPSGNLDTETGTKVIDLLFSLAEEAGMTLILVTHDMQLANRCKRKIHLTGGLLQ
jgi:putative ABC transport system ATP-binding protein